MKVEYDAKYDKNFPETFDWELVDSPKIEQIACDIKKSIMFDLASRNRVYAGGLRQALNIIAQHADL